MKKYLNKNINTGNISVADTSHMYYEFFVRFDYDWWRPIREGDVVVDIGSCIGFFTCHAIDMGASKIYSVEPNKENLKTLMYNVSDYIIDTKDTEKVIPIHAAIGLSEASSNHVFGGKGRDPIYHTRTANSSDEYTRKSFKQFIKENSIDYIDFLKIDCEGGEYEIFTEENINFLKNNVSHMAVEFHMDMTPGDNNHTNWKYVRDKLLPRFNQVRWMSDEDQFDAYNDSKATGGFMVYITN